MDYFDWVVRTLVAFGVPTLVVYFVKEKRRRNAEDRVIEADADVAEAAVLYRNRNTSITSLEAEIAALQRTFDADRATKQATIDWLNGQLVEERRVSAERERLHLRQIAVLEGKVAGLQQSLADVSEQLTRVNVDLRRLRGDVGA